MTATAAPSGGAPTRPRVRLLLASVAVLLAAADTYVVVLALPSIMNDVGIGLDQLQRATPIISGFLLGYVVVLPLLGRLSDRHGRRPVFVGCLAAFTLGSVMTATASGLPLVVAGRTIQGLGGGGLVPVTLALVADLWPPGRRGVPLGVVGAVQELGSVLGPLYGSVIVAWSGWRTIFWINVPVSVLLAAAFVLTARTPGPAGGGAEAGTAGTAARRRVDVVGGVLLLLAVLAGCLTLTAPAALADDATWGQLYGPVVAGAVGDLTTPIALATWVVVLLFVAWEVAAGDRVRAVLPLRRLPAILSEADWPGAALLGLVLAGIILAFSSADPGRAVLAPEAAWCLPLAGICALLFVVRERRAGDPLVDFGALADRAAFGSLLTNLAVGAALMAALVDVPIFARATQFPDSQVQAALVLVRFLAAVPIGAVLGGVLSDRLGYRAVTAGGMLLSAVMFALMTRWSDGTLAELIPHTPLHGSDLVLALCGLGFGLAIAPVNAAMLGAVRPALHGLASALVVVARMVGMLVGVSVLTAVGLHQFALAQSHITSPLRLCPKTPTSCPAYDRMVTAAVLEELHAVFLGAAICAVIAAVLAMALLRRRHHGLDATLRGTRVVATGG